MMHPTISFQISFISFHHYTPTSQTVLSQSSTSDNNFDPEDLDDVAYDVPDLLLNKKIQSEDFNSIEIPISDKYNAKTSDCQLSDELLKFIDPDRVLGSARGRHEHDPRFGAWVLRRPDLDISPVLRATSRRPVVSGPPCCLRAASRGPASRP